MLKRTIFIGNPAYLKLKENHLHIIDPKTKSENGKIPIEDMAYLILDNFQITISHQLIQELQEHNVAVVSCDQQHQPKGLMLPITGHVEHTERLKHQLNCTEPLRKQLWKQTVEAKIYQQQQVLKKEKKPCEAMTTYIQNIKSGDATNMEGIAAQYYWSQLFDSFKRERKGDAPNNLLNFGYAILRSIVARAVISSGLHPAIGLYHKNKYNAYCLADDLMEPYRPYVDLLILEWMDIDKEPYPLTIEAKAHLMKLATLDVNINGLQRPLMTAVSITSSSLYKCFSGENRTIRYPMLR